MNKVIYTLLLMIFYGIATAQQAFPTQMEGIYICEPRNGCINQFVINIERDSLDSTRFILNDSCPNAFSGQLNMNMISGQNDFSGFYNGCTTQGELFPQNDSLFGLRTEKGCGSGCTCVLFYKCKKVLSTSQTEHKLEQLKLYPNPVKENLQIDGLQQMVNYRLYNLQGQLVLSGQVSNQASINMLGLVEGLYLLQLSKGEKSVWHKVVKE